MAGCRSAKSNAYIVGAVAVAAALFLSAACVRNRRGDSTPRREVAPRAVSRVVSLAPNLTELLFAVGCGARVAGVDDHSNFPPEVARLPKVGGLPPNVERIVALRPDVVFASSAVDQTAVAAALRQAGIEMHVINTDRLEDVPRAASTLARAARCGDGDAWAREFRARLDRERRTRNRPPRVLYLAWHDPLYVAGSGTFADDLLRISGAANAASAVSGWPQYTREALLAHPPDVILFPTRELTRELLLERFHDDPVWSRLEAVRAGRVIVADEDRFTRSGPRAPEAADELSRKLDEFGFH